MPCSLVTSGSHFDEMSIGGQADVLFASGFLEDDLCGWEWQLQWQR